MRHILGIIFFFLFLSVSISCRHSVVYHNQRTYFETHDINPYPANALATLEIHSPMQQTGVFQYHFYAIQPLPALLFLNTERQLEFVLVADSLDAAIGDVVQITGDVGADTLTRGKLYSQPVKRLQASTVQVVHPSNNLFEAARSYYREHRDSLSAWIRVQGSHLELPETPEWQLFVDEPRSHYIVSCSAADLMYAAQLALVYDLTTRRLTDIYGKQWFKGE